MAREIFISCSRKDLEKVKAIKAEIEKATGAECWMDLEGRGVQKSVRKAHELLKETADEGNTRAQYLLGKLLLEHYVYIEISQESSNAHECARWSSLHETHLDSQISNPYPLP